MSLTLLLGFTMILIAGASFVAGAWLLLHPARTRRDRLTEYTGGVVATDGSAPIRSVSKLAAYAERIARLASEGDERELDKQRRRLLLAGFRSPSNMAWYNAWRVVLALAFPLLGFALAPGLTTPVLAVSVLIMAFFGYYLPHRVVEHLATKRADAIMRAFPDALDLLVSGTEAGLGIDAAVKRVAQEMEVAAPELALELQIVVHEIAAGIPRAKALRRLAERVSLEAINSLVNVLVQAEKLGTSVAKALRVHASLVRKRRILAAEEQAAKIAPKMTIAMIIFLMPTLFVVILGPAVVNLMRNLMPALAG
jgi:tight adherence protein C